MAEATAPPARAADPLLAPHRGRYRFDLALRYWFNTVHDFAPDVSSVSAYISAIGVVYGILAAFTIYVVWTQFNDAENAADTELDDLMDLFRFALYLKDQRALEALQTAMVGYSQSVADDEWPAMTVGTVSAETAKHFGRVFHAINAVQFDDARDAEAWGGMIRKFEAMSDARSKRLGLAKARMPFLLRGLLYLASLALVAGFFMLSIDNNFLAVLVTAVTTAIVFLTIEVVEDLDDPFGGQWSLSADGFRELPNRLTEAVEAATGEQ